MCCNVTPQNIQAVEIYLRSSKMQFYIYTYYKDGDFRTFGSSVEKKVLTRRERKQQEKCINQGCGYIKVHLIVEINREEKTVQNS